MNFDSMRLVGPETLTPATARPCWSKIGPATQIECRTFGPRS
jgi:hypothetical protein